jgi:hypothetical protein
VHGGSERYRRRVHVGHDEGVGFTTQRLWRRSRVGWGRGVAGLGAVVVCLLVTGVPTASASSTAVVVGRWGFEHPVVAPAFNKQFPPGSEFGGWTVSNETVSLSAQNGDPRFPAAHGNQFFSLADATATPFPGPAGTVCRTVPVVRGHTYRLSLDIAATGNGTREKFILTLGTAKATASVRIVNGLPWVYSSVSRVFGGRRVGPQLCLTAVPIDVATNPAWPIVDDIVLRNMGPS